MKAFTSSRQALKSYYAMSRVELSKTIKRELFFREKIQSILVPKRRLMVSCLEPWVVRMFVCPTTTSSSKRDTPLQARDEKKLSRIMYKIKACCLPRVSQNWKLNIGHFLTYLIHLKNLIYKVNMKYFSIFATGHSIQFWIRVFHSLKNWLSSMD